MPYKGAQKKQNTHRGCNAEKDIAIAVKDFAIGLRNRYTVRVNVDEERDC